MNFFAEKTDFDILRGYINIKPKGVRKMIPFFKHKGTLAALDEVEKKQNC